jgi:hypothetical protein
VGGTDLYYGGTAYDNNGGLGIQWEVESVQQKPTIEAPKAGQMWTLAANEMLVVPIAELYDRRPAFAASDELIGNHIPVPYVLLSDIDAKQLGVADGDTVNVMYSTQSVPMIAKVQPMAPAGAVLMPRHLSDRPAPAIPVAGTVRKVEVMANV